MTTQNVKKFLILNLSRESKLYYGVNDTQWIDCVANAWMNDKSNSAWRYESIKDFSGINKNSKILDMASGCGTFVFYGLLNGYDVYGIEPEEWKNQFNKMKIKLYNYPKNWENHFIKAFGENLPFQNESFDIISSYQTLEHVSNVRVCLKEMLRVIKKGGGIFLHFPNYQSTFEGHYRLPWLPLFQKNLAKIYLKILKRPTLGLDTINYVTKGNIIYLLRMLGGSKIIITDLDKVSFHKRTKHIIKKLSLKKMGYIGKIIAPIINLTYTYFYIPMKKIFRSEKSVHLFIQKI